MPPALPGPQLMGGASWNSSQKGRSVSGAGRGDTGFAAILACSGIIILESVFSLKTIKIMTMTSSSAGWGYVRLYKVGRERENVRRAHRSHKQRLAPFLLTSLCLSAPVLMGFTPVCHLVCNWPLLAHRTCFQGPTLCPTRCSIEGVLKTFLGHFVLFLPGASSLRTGAIPSLSLPISHHQSSKTPICQLWVGHRPLHHGL